MALYHQTVSLDDGNDSNDGFAWNRPKLTIAAAVAALPNGGDIYLAPSSLSVDGATRSAYAPTSTITLNGHRILGMGNWRGPSGGSAPSRRQVEIAHSFNGHLFNVISGSIRDVTLFNTGSFTGHAIHNVSAGAPPTNQNSGYMDFRNINVTGSSPWERDVYIDGTPFAVSGTRSLFFQSCQFFGCTTVGETVVIKRGVHVFMADCEVVLAPASVAQGMKFLDAGSEDIYLSNVRIGESDGSGTFHTEAAGGLAFVGGKVTGAITCAAGSAKNRFAPMEFGSFSNSGAASNACKQLAA